MTNTEKVPYIDHNFDPMRYYQNFAKKGYCISARDRESGWTQRIAGPFSKKEADEWMPTAQDKNTYKYFRVSKDPFKPHKKDESYGAKRK